MNPVSFCLSVRGDIYVYDNIKGKMTFFDSEGDYKRDFIIKEILLRKFHVDEEDYIYAICEEFDPVNLNMNVNFVKLSPEGKVEKIFYRAFRLKLISFKEKGKAGNLLYEHPYLTSLYFTPTPKGNFVLMNSMKYEIMLFSKKVRYC